MSFLSAVQTNLGGGNKAEELEGQPEGEGNSLKPREFFWDNIVLFVVSTILGLAAIDVITEFLRGGLGGGGVACFPTSGADEAQAAYINNYCSSFLPFGTYVTTFMVVHAVLLIVPHYLWLGHYGGNFEFFFQLASTLKRVQDHTRAGERIPENLAIVQQLESTFTLLDRNFIYRSYILKLMLQFLWSLVGIGFGAGFFVTRFTVRFACPPNLNSTTYEFWPFNESVDCTYETLSLLQFLWIGDLLLLLLASLSLFGAILWSFSTHPNALGYKELGHFAFQSGFHPRYYVPPFPGSECLHQYFTSVPYPSLSSPHVIKTDLDFLVLRLYQTDGGLGHVFKEELIQKELKHHLDDDQRRLGLHRGKHWTNEADDKRYGDLDKRYDLKWNFPKVENMTGVYADFSTLAPGEDEADTVSLLVPNSMCGAVLGFAALAPNNNNAINISFGDSGYTTALARLFKWVAHLNFSPSFNSSMEATKVTHYFNKVVSLVCAEDVLSSSNDIRAEFQEKLKHMWSPDNFKCYDTTYIVVGPIPKDKEFHLSNLHLLLEAISGCLEKGAVLVCIHPLKIGGKPVKEKFLDYVPMELRFEHYFVSTEKTNKENDWKARVPRSVQPLQQSKATSEPSSKVSAPDTPSLDTKSPQASPKGPKRATVSHPYRHCVNATCGSLECEVRFSLYKYKDDPKVNRPAIFRPSSDEESGSDEDESDDGEGSMIQVSGKMKVKNLSKKTKED